MILLPGLAGGAAAAPFLPPPGQIFAGETGGPMSDYVAAAGKHPPVLQIFSAWGQYLPAIFADAAAARARLMISITTAFGASEAITPGGLARGAGDGWLEALGRAAAASKRVTYVRPMAEMDGYWNPYCAYNADGSRRNRDHAPATYRRAWKRIALILRGGAVAEIDAELRRLGMPPLRGEPAQGSLPAPQVSLLWVPQVAGAPDVAGNQPLAYWPGRRWVDWVGTDFYARFPNFSGLSSFYRAFGGLPFAFGEYALWGADDPAWIGALFGWVRDHPRVRMLVYNQGLERGGPFRLSRYPRAAAALRGALRGPRFPEFAPELAAPGAA